MGPPYHVIEWQLTAGMEGRARLAVIDREYANLLAHACMNGITFTIPEITAMPDIRIKEVVLNTGWSRVDVIGHSAQYLPGALEVEIVFEEA